MRDVDEDGHESPVRKSSILPNLSTPSHFGEIHRRSLSHFGENSADNDPRHATAKSLIESTFAEYALALIIMTNLLIIIMEADHSGECESEGKGEKCPTVMLHSVMNYVFLVIYTLESFARLYVYGRSFCTDLWNPFDLVIVVAGYMDIILRSFVDEQDLDLNTLSILRLFRIARLARTIKIFRHMPELQAMIRGFKSAIGAMGYGFFFILFLLLMAGILAVELIHPINMECETDARCNDVFLSVIKAVLLFFQTLVAGDSWGLCALPIIKKNPLSMLLFASVLVIVQLGFTNLILSVIVEKAAEARQHDSSSHRRERQAAIARLARIARQIDSSNNGTITEEEFREGMEKDSEFRQLLEVLDIGEDDVSSLFYLMDSDKSGDLSIEEFVRTIAKSSADDIRKQMMYLRLNVTYHKVGLTNRMNRMGSGMQSRIDSMADRVAELQLILNGGRNRLRSCFTPRPCSL